MIAITTSSSMRVKAARIDCGHAATFGKGCFVMAGALRKKID
jgi:hypothetical protein